MLLGEGEHGDGHTWEIKTELVRALVESCGFDSMYVESGMYDFLPLDRAHAAGTATAKDVANAIGALWAEARETQAWITYIHEAAAANRLEVMGLDDQIHSTAFYAQRELPAVLAAHLPPGRKEECEARIARHHQWTYDEAHPHSEASQAELLSCYAQIEAAVAKAAPSTDTSEALVMAKNLGRWVARDFFTDGQAVFNARDRSMFANFQWHRQRAGARARRSCGARRCMRPRTSAGSRRTAGSRRSGSTSASTTASARRRSVFCLVRRDPAARSPGARAVRRAARVARGPRPGAGAAAPLPRRRRAARAGLGRGAPLNHEFRRAAWHEVLDGLVVMRRETPAHHDASQAAKKGPHERAERRGRGRPAGHLPRGGRPGAPPRRRSRSSAAHRGHVDALGDGRDPAAGGREPGVRSDRARRRIRRGPRGGASRGRVAVTSDVSGTVQSIEVRNGQRVAAGQVLVQLDDAAPRAELSRVEQEYHQRLVELLRSPPTTPSASAWRP
ncbi:biotin/lipoyl-binding protein [Nannocystis pusilla]|uniref:erythromycin esterase family protein n=1 Tax=Nannocystis pusilla TaxID=889268 RepID=UPI003B7A906D